MKFFIYNILGLFTCTQLIASEIQSIDCDGHYLWLKNNKLTTNYDFTVDLTKFSENELKKKAKSRALAKLKIPAECKTEWASQGLNNENEAISSKKNLEIVEKSKKLESDRNLMEFEVIQSNDENTELKGEISFLDNLLNRKRVLPLKKFPKIDLFFRASTANSHLLGITTQRPNAILSTYRRLVPRLSLYTCGRAPSPSNTAEFSKYKSCSEEQSKKSIDRFNNYMNNVSDQYLYHFANAYSNILNDRDIVILRHFHNIINSTPKEGQTMEGVALDYLRSLRTKLTTDEKLTLAQMWGAQFVDAYDHSRSDELARAKGVVTLDQLLNGAKYNNSINYYGDNPYRNSYSSNYSLADWEGICRDIASGQGQMLRAMGLKNTFVVSLAQTSGSYHTVLITQDPDQPQKLYGLDYSNRHDIIGGNSDGLLNSQEDISLTYRIFIPGGRMVDNIQSSLGKVLSEASGFSALDPLARNAPLMASTNVEIVKGLSLKGGYATDHQGNDYVFGGASYSWGSGKVAVTFAHQDREAISTNSYSDAKNLDILYAQIEQKFKTRNLKFNSNLNGRIEALVGLMAMGSRVSGGDNDGKLGLQADLYSEFSAVMEQRGENFEANYRAGIQVSPGIADIRNNYIWQIPILALNHLFLSAEGRKSLAQSKLGRIYLVAATILLVDELGIRGRIQGGVEIGRVRIIGRLQGRLTNSTLNIQDGSERRVGLNVEWKLTDFMSIVLDGSTALGEDYIYSLNPFEFFGSLRLIF